MKKSTKVLLGIASIWPVIYIPIFLLAVFSFVIFGGPPGKEPPAAFPLIFLVIFAVHMLTVFVTLGTKIFYIVNVFKNPKVEKDKQLMWVLLLVLAGLFAEPVYWYLNIWRDRPDAAQGAPKALDNAEAAAWTSAAGAAHRERDFSTPPPPHSWRD
jgi:hypothetical protein